MSPSPGDRWRSSLRLPLCAGMLSLLLLFPARLAGQTTRYWDINGATPGAGGAAPAGDWSAGLLYTNWTTDPTGGDANTTPWYGNDHAVFSAGSDATGVFKVTIGSSATATQYVNSVTIEEGAITFGPGKVNLTGKGAKNATAKFEVKAGASAGFPGTAAGSLTGTNGLNKLGDGALGLGGAQYYQGNTYVDAGTLVVNGSLGGGAVTVDGGTLAGNGTIHGAVTVNGGGTLSPGISIGALTVNNDLILRGNTLVEVDRDAGTNDFVGGINTLTVGGMLTIANAGSPLQVGDSFRLFSATTYADAGSFAFSPGTPGEGLAWFYNNGVLSVVAGSGGRPTLHMTGTNNTLTFSWSGSFILQGQTNIVGLTTNWHEHAPDGGISPVNVTIDPANSSVFFRLSSP